MIAVLAGVGACVAGWLALRELRRAAPEAAEPERGRRSALLQAVGGRMRLPLPRETGELVLAAGLVEHGIDARAVMGAKAVATLLGLAGGMVASLVLPGRLGLLVMVLGPVAGFVAPDLWLRRLARYRRDLLRRELPALIDLLRVAVAAGLPLTRAIATVARHGEGVLAREWRVLGAQLSLGVPLASALGDLDARLPFPEVAALTAGLRRASRHGSALEDTLRGQAREAREARARMVRESSARAGPKIQLVVALMLVPSVLLMVAAALVSALAGSGGLPI